MSDRNKHKTFGDSCTQHGKGFKERINSSNLNSHTAVTYDSQHCRDVRRGRLNLMNKNQGMLQCVVVRAAKWVC